MSKEHRYELTDRQWERLAPHLSGKNGDIGCPCDDNRRFINGVLWITRSGAPAIVTMAARPPGALRQVGNGFSAVQPMVESRVMERHLFPHRRRRRY